MTDNVIKQANKHRAAKTDEDKYRFFQPGETVAIEEGPYGDFGSDRACAAHLIRMGFNLGVYDPSSVAFRRRELELFGGDGDDLNDLIEDVLSDFNDAIEQDDDDDPLSWGLHEGTVFFHRQLWWDQENPSSLHHVVKYHRTITTSVTVRPDKDGNIVIQEQDGEEVVDFVDGHLVCETCGYLGGQLLKSHGISEEWQEA